MVNKPAGLVKAGPGGDQAVSISVLPDFMAPKDRLAFIEKSAAIVNGVETDSELRYKVNPQEEFEDEDDLEEEKEDKTQKEYIFLIDRSGSMY